MDRIAELQRQIEFYEGMAMDCRLWNDPMRYLPAEHAADLRKELARIKADVEAA